jgi:hypothetical protein
MPHCRRPTGAEQPGQLAAELDALAGWLDLVLDRLGAGVDPARAPVAGG